MPKVTITDPAIIKRTNQKNVVSPITKQDVLGQISLKIDELERMQQEFYNSLSYRPVVIKKVVVKKVNSEKLEFKLDKISVKDLSGMLSIGVNSGPKLERQESKKPNEGANNKKHKEKKEKKDKEKDKDKKEEKEKRKQKEQKKKDKDKKTKKT